MSHQRFSSGHRIQTNRLAVRITLLAFATAMVVQSGCNVIRAFDDTAALTFRDLVWSRRAFNLRYGNCDRPYAEHFRNGFVAGYRDVSSGGDGFAPALPPQSYRSYEFQSADGSRCVDAWFEGYPAGVAAAKKDNSGSFNNIAVSRMIDAALKQEKDKPLVAGRTATVPSSASSKETSPPVPTTPPKLSLPQPLVPPNSVPDSPPSFVPSNGSATKFPPIRSTGFVEDGETPIAFGRASSWESP